MSDSNTRALVAHIDGESIDLESAIEASDDFVNDFSAVNKVLKADEARYIIYKADSLVLISYVPDCAKVRSKMMYASSSTALLRQLGGAENFSSTSIFWTELEEVSVKGWKDHLAHEALAPPLTQQEASLRDVRHFEASQMLGTDASKSRLPSSVSAANQKSSFQLDFSPEAANDITTLAQPDSFGAIALQIELPSETVVKINSSSDSRLSGSFFPKNDAQYTFFKNTDGKAYLFYTCPSNTPVKKRMIHATSLKSVLERGKELGLEIVEKYEGDDGEELVAEFYSDLEKLSKAGSQTTSMENKPRFNRPKAPGRRNKAA